MGAIRETAQRVAAEDSRIEQIILFGSYAKGDPGFRSDADLLIVLSSDNRRMPDRLPEFLLKFAEAPVPVDVLVYTRSELDAALAAENRFLRGAMEGVRLV